MPRCQSCIVRGIGPSTAPTTAPSSNVPGLLRRGRMALLVYFGILGVIDGVWLARLPAVKQHLGLSDAQLGVALLAAPVGLVIVAAFADRLIDRFGSARPAVAGAAAISLLPITFGLAGSMAVLMAALLVYGISGGLADVAVNAQAVRVERGYRRPIINSFHACFSFGGLLGALLGGLFAWAGIGPAPTFAAAGVPMAVVAVLARGRLLHGSEASDSAAVPATDRDPAGEGAGKGARRHAVALRIAALGLLALCSLLAEG